MTEWNFSVEAKAAPLREEVAKKLRYAISAGRFNAGDRLRESHLVELLNVSRTTVREALRELEANGLVTVIPNRGPVVSTIDLEDAIELYEMLELLESRAGIRFVANASPSQIDQLEDVVRAMRVDLQDGNGSNVMILKEEFYSILFEGAGDRLAKSVHDRCYARIALLRSKTLYSPSRQHQAVRELQDAVDAIRHGDPDAVANGLAAYVKKARQTAIEQLSGKQG